MVVRWNPDAYTPLPGRPRLRRPDRLRLFVQLKAHLRTLDNAALGAPIVVFYMFYDRDSPRVCRNLPHHFVDSEEDLAAIGGARAGRESNPDRDPAAPCFFLSPPSHRSPQTPRHSR